MFTDDAQNLVKPPEEARLAAALLLSTFLGLGTSWLTYELVVPQASDPSGGAGIAAWMDRLAYAFASGLTVTAITLVVASRWTRR